jgi:hypothetical protein
MCSTTKSKKQSLLPFKDYLNTDFMKGQYVYMDSPWNYIDIMEKIWQNVSDQLILLNFNITFIIITITVTTPMV